MTPMARRAPGDARLGPHRYGLVLALTFVTAAFTLLAPDGSFARVTSLLAAGGTLLAGVVTSEAPRRTRKVLAVALIALVLAGALIDLVASPGPWGILGDTALMCAATIGVTAGGLVRLVVERGVVVQAVLGAIAVYLLIGLTFAFAIGALATALHEPYFAQGTDATQSTRTYFSFTSLTTTGYGDYTAGLVSGRALAVLEMLVGQLYLVTVIALLVGNLGRRRERA